MVQLFKKKQTMEKLVKIGEMFGWDRTFWKGNVKFTRGKNGVAIFQIDGGYKVLYLTNNRPVHAEVVPKKEHALILTGESMAYFKW